MAATTTKDERISARVPHHVRDTLQQAADLTGATLNQFLVQSAVKEARAIIERERTIHFSQRDAEIFFSALDNPRAPNKKLVEAVMAYKGSALHDQNRAAKQKT